MAPSKVASETIASSLRATVTGLYDAGSLDLLTVNYVRSLVEKKLGLPLDHLKNDDQWKSRSKTIIRDQVENEQNRNSRPPSPNKSATKVGAAKGKSRDRQTNDPAPTSKKRKAQTAKVRGPKRRRLSTSSASSIDQEEDDEASSGGSPDKSGSDNTAKNATTGGRVTTAAVSSTSLRKAVTTPRQKARKQVVESEEGDDEKSKSPARIARGSIKETSSGDSEDSSGNEESTNVNGTSQTKELETSHQLEVDPESGSETSVLIDDPPPSKKQRKSSGASTKKAPKNAPTKKPASVSGLKSASAATDPDTEEIKRLQGWLVKCGTRKVWSKELAAYASSKAKIKHLKDLLTEIGMTGRYSTQKAAEIKERRELLAEVEAVQVFDQRFGQDKDEEVGRDARSSKRGGAAMLADLGFATEESSSEEEVQPKERSRKVVSDEDSDD